VGILFLITFIDILGFGIIIPILPNLQAKFLLDPFQIGLLVASFSIFGLIGNLFLKIKVIV
jgi:MFS family permease